MMNNRHPILLIGFMGSGKTTIGQMLARDLQLDFVDLDAMIVQHEQKTIPQIFETFGEEGFRKREYNQLKKQLTSAKIIATGGGIVEFKKSFQLLKSKEITIIWLDAPFQTLYNRVHSDSNRPNAHAKSFSSLKNLYLSRISRYNEIAFIKVNTDKSLSIVLDEIKKALFANDQY
ncbi:shikimate kinase [Staphylococcus chromogenes]|uniref:shikimate kinase n=1 Tax=Staphylococcus chromogenes TaxID=46126 RepID=UPI002884465D|nr:shikimate kinase [Staphylococcus chromogenes]MDT0734915.1 shikimate kinase [Staphylococcus chromogenes]MDT0748994.1 shikimate kinase [Staphylococcus chromogenes]